MWGWRGTDFWSYRPTERRNLEAASEGYDQAPPVGFDRTLNDPRGCRGKGGDIVNLWETMRWQGRSPFVVFLWPEEAGSTKAKEGLPAGRGPGL